MLTVVFEYESTQYGKYWSSNGRQSLLYRVPRLACLARL